MATQTEIRLDIETIEDIEMELERERRQLKFAESRSEMFGGASIAHQRGKVEGMEHVLAMVKRWSV